MAQRARAGATQDSCVNRTRQSNQPSGLRMPQVRRGIPVARGAPSRPRSALPSTQARTGLPAPSVRTALPAPSVRSAIPGTTARTGIPSAYRSGLPTFQSRMPCPSLTAARGSGIGRGIRRMAPPSQALPPCRVRSPSPTPLQPQAPNVSRVTCPNVSTAASQVPPKPTCPASPSRVPHGALPHVHPAPPCRVSPAPSCPGQPSSPPHVHPASPCRVPPASPCRVPPGSPAHVHPASPCRALPSSPQRVSPTCPRRVSCSSPTNFLNLSQESQCPDMDISISYCAGSPENVKNISKESKCPYMGHSSSYGAEPQAKGLNLSQESQCPDMDLSLSYCDEPQANVRNLSQESKCPYMDHSSSSEPQDNLLNLSQESQCPDMDLSLSYCDEPQENVLNLSQESQCPDMDLSLDYGAESPDYLNLSNVSAPSDMNLSLDSDNYAQAYSPNLLQPSYAARREGPLVDLAVDQSNRDPNLAWQLYRYGLSGNLIPNEGYQANACQPEEAQAYDPMHEWCQQPYIFEASPETSENLIDPERDLDAYSEELYREMGPFF